MYIVVFVTCARKKEAENIARALLKNKLAACVNILEGVRSFFWWQGKIDRAGEVLLVIKTKKSKFKALTGRVGKLHSYTVPEIIALPVAAGDKPYLDWIDESLTF